MSKSKDLNIFGEELKTCCYDPMTGYFRDGSCKTDYTDRGTHTVCAIITDKFLQYTLAKGNDLISANAYFPGLKVGDKWCLCAMRWQEAVADGAAPPLDLEATNIKTLEHVKYDELIKYDKEKVLAQQILADLSAERDLLIIFSASKDLEIATLPPLILVTNQEVYINNKLRPNLSSKYFHRYFNITPSTLEDDYLIKFMIKRGSSEYIKLSE